MIKITIEQVTTREVPIKKNFIKESEPMLDHQNQPLYEDSGYSSSGKRTIARKETYEIVDVTESQTTRITLLQQEIPEDVAFNLQAVIAAVNNMVNEE